MPQENRREIETATARIGEQGRRRECVKPIELPPAYEEVFEVAERIRQMYAYIDPRDLAILLKTVLSGVK